MLLLYFSKPHTAQTSRGLTPLRSGCNRIWIHVYFILTLKPAGNGTKGWFKPGCGWNCGAELQKSCHTRDGCSAAPSIQWVVQELLAVTIQSQRSLWRSQSTEKVNIGLNNINKSIISINASSTLYWPLKYDEHVILRITRLAHVLWPHQHHYKVKPQRNSEMFEY